MHFLLTTEQLSPQQTNEIKNLGPRVRKAAAWLDVRYPGWHDKIKLDTLNMYDPTQCVAVQIGVSWLYLRDCFEADTGVWGIGVFSNNNIGLDAWKEEILNRRETKTKREPKTKAQPEANPVRKEWPSMIGASSKSVYGTVSTR